MKNKNSKMTFEELRSALRDCNNNKGGNDPCNEYEKLSEKEKELLTKWIRAYMVPIKTFNHRHTSYGLKHIYSANNQDHYITNGAFKGVMFRCGHIPEDIHDLNWYFAISEKPLKNLREGS